AFIHIGSPSWTAPPSSSHRDKAAAPNLASLCGSSVGVSLLQPPSFLCLCRNRAICPRSAAVSSNLPTDPAVSKTSRCSVVGKVFHCMMSAAPRHRRTYSAPRDGHGSKRARHCCDRPRGPALIRHRSEASLQPACFRRCRSLSMTTDLWSPLIHGELRECSERKRAPASQRARRVGTSTQSDAAYGKESRVEGRAFARGDHLPKEARLSC